ncbi:hypothetical protein CN978_11235 [Priestia megaterium]|uniref:glycosyltransferase family 4 protein n=1 Tax=Priestia megaterium TaxID=1404 RepID=UPI000BF3A088|nr:glycosyltransferase family 4 protein [Priestia megaterium]PET70549.1 hypothetical protein CN533_17975 [Priestia megaterium]PFK85977.1 hypothetical protein COJ19_18360 [Priestia megaterium]PGN66494.1 hypothetical protein CN978_11235 [Priestia megaterium]
MKILLINKYYYIKGGSETYFFGLKQMLEKNGHEVAVFSMKDEKNFNTPYNKYFVENINYENDKMIEKIKNAGKLIHSQEASENLSKLIQDFQPDLAHVNLIYHQLTPSIFHTLKKNKIPIVFTSHDYKPVCPNYKLLTNNHLCDKCVTGNFTHCFLNKCHKASSSFSFLLMIEAFYHRYKKSYHLADYIVCPSKFMLSKLEQAGFNKDSLIHIPNFITNDFSNYSIENDDLNLKNKRNSILYYGRLSKEKGLDFLLDAKREMDNKFTLEIVGTGPEEEHLKRRVHYENIKGVEFLGFKSGDELINLIKNCKATILPANWHEVFGLTIIESHSIGTPVIGSDLGGIGEIIKNGKNGFIYNNGDLKSLKKSISQLFDLNEKQYQEMASNSLNSSKKYKPEEYYKKIINVYSKLLQEKVG